MAEGVKLEDRWGYYVATSSQACVSAINSYYHQVPHFTSPLSLSLSLWLFLNLILIFLSLLKLFDINTQMGVWKVLIYGRERSVILEAVAHDKHCVLANILAAHFLHSSGSSRALTCLHAAKSNLVPSHLLPTIACFFVLFCFSDSIHQKQKIK